MKKLSRKLDLIEFVTSKAIENNDVEKRYILFDGMDYDHLDKLLELLVIEEPTHHEKSEEMFHNLQVQAQIHYKLCQFNESLKINEKLLALLDKVNVKQVSKVEFYKQTVLINKMNCLINLGLIAKAWTIIENDFLIINHVSLKDSKVTSAENIIEFRNNIHEYLRTKIIDSCIKISYECQNNKYLNLFMELKKKLHNFVSSEAVENSSENNEQSINEILDKINIKFNYILENMLLSLNQLDFSGLKEYSKELSYEITKKLNLQEEFNGISCDTKFDLFKVSND